MKKLLLTLPLLAASSLPAQAVNVETFLANNCSSCHGSEVYTRENRRVKNMEQLEVQMHRCNSAIGVKMDIATEHAVMDYLNKHYYHFKE